MAEFADRRGTAGRYAVRRYRDGDRAEVRSLYESVGEPHSEAWFAWRFEHNPFVSHVPLVVATASDDGVVGALPLDAVRLGVPGESVLGFRVGTPLVRPGADRDEVVSRLAAATADHYADGDPHVRFRFDDRTADVRWFGSDARVAGVVPTHYRVQRPSALVGEGSPWSRLASTADRTAAGYLELRDRLVGVPDDATVYRYTDIPVDLLRSLYRRGVPDGVHALHDPSYYHWRFSNPERPATTYVATLDDEPAAAVVTHARTVDGVRRVDLVDVVPLRPTRGRTAATKALLAVVVEEHADTDLLVAFGSAFPAAALRAFGFSPDTALPLSRVLTPTTLRVAPPAGGTETRPDCWTLGDRSLDDVADWTVTSALRDPT